LVAVGAILALVSDESVAVVLTEFANFLNQAAMTHGLAVNGIQLSVAQMENAPRSPKNPDPDVYMGIGDPNVAGSTTYASAKLSELRWQLADNGPVITSLGQQWAVLVDAEWEEHFRPSIAEAHNCNSNDLKYPLFGDLRKLRNDIVHHRGIATAQNVGRCELLIHWSEIGQTIFIDAPSIAEFLRRVPWNELRSGPSS